jgi:hypothetical protein
MPSSYIQNPKRDFILKQIIPVLNYAPRHENLRECGGRTPCILHHGTLLKLVMGFTLIVLVNQEISTREEQRLEAK